MVSVFGKPLEGEVLQEDDRLGVADLACSDHPERVFQGDLNDLDILAFVELTATFSPLVAPIVVADEEGEVFGDGTRTHVDVEKMGQRADGIAGLLDQFLPHPRFGCLAIEKPGRRLDEIGRAAVQIDRQPELPGQKNTVTFGIVEKRGRTVAAIVSLAGVSLPGAIAPPQVEGVLVRVPQSSERTFDEWMRIGSDSDIWHLSICAVSGRNVQSQERQNPC